MSWVATLEYLMEGGGSVVGCYPRIPNKRRDSVVGRYPRILNRRRGQCRGLLP